MATEKQIELAMKNLDLTREEAIDMLKSDVEDIKEEKSEEPKKKGSSLDKVKTQKAKKKIDAVKEQLMLKIKYMLELANVENPQQVTSSKYTFKIGKDYFSISLTRHKTKPDGYSDE